MVTLEGEILLLDRAQDGEDILPLVHHGTGGKVEWFIDIGIAEETVKNLLVDAEILDAPVPFRYINARGQQADGIVHVEELISDEEGDRCRLRGTGKPPEAFLVDEPQEI